MTKNDYIRLPLNEAYEFASQRGLGAHGDRIRRRGFDTKIRRAYMAILFAQEGIFEEFKQRYWRNGDSPDGRRRLDEALRLKEGYERFLLFGE